MCGIFVESRPNIKKDASAAAAGKNSLQPSKLVMSDSRYLYLNLEALRDEHQKYVFLCDSKYEKLQNPVKYKLTGPVMTITKFAIDTPIEGCYHCGFSLDLD